MYNDGNGILISTYYLIYFNNKTYDHYISDHFTKMKEGIFGT